MSSPFQQQFSAKSPLNQDKKIIGEDTYNLVKDKNSGNFVSGLSLDGGTSEPEFTNDRLVLTTKQKKNMGENVSKFGGGEWIEQSHPMTVVKDSASGGRNYYGLKQPEKIKK
jgi:hypothetical protein